MLHIWLIRWAWRVIRYPFYLNMRYNPLMTGVALRGLQSLGTIPDADIAQMTDAEIREMYAFSPFDERFKDNPPASTPETRAFAEELAARVRKRLEDQRRDQDPPSDDQQSS